eukprot:TRINITY_DN8121_c0_g1_i1.p1 TRINITY_DN8121_c0_g1~~TRINITY_DN8121_c0_g1_i1.p1  ORF type:complete len:268 (-),score=60.37 TRINITY_DN8121_c0_g1_i1:197-973(-)
MKLLSAVVVLVAALLPLACVLFWLYLGLEGDYNGLAFSWSTDTSQWQTFNWHPLLMVLAFGTLFTMSACAYKVLPMSHDAQKLVHGVLNLMALIAAAGGITVAFVFKHESGNVNMYTAHSWLGMGAFALFAAQFIGGFVSFGFPKLPPALRASVHPFHIFGGFVIYGLTSAAIFTGAMDRQYIGGGGGGSYGISSWPDLRTYSWVGLNLIAISVVLAAAVVMWVHRPPTQRELYAHQKPAAHVQEETPFAPQSQKRFY